MTTNDRGNRRVVVFDTTLRDGEQAPGNGMSPETKLELGLEIESLGVDTIETGFPGFVAQRLRGDAAALAATHPREVCHLRTRYPR